jgi:hypothetical protein
MKYAASQRRHRWASGIFGGDERDRPCCRAARGRRPAQHPAENPHQLFRRREQAMQRFRRSRRAEVRLSSCPGAQPIQSGSPSRDEGPPQLKTLGCLGRVSRSRGINRRSRDGGRAACRQAYGAFTTPRVPLRAGVIVSNVYGGLANGFLHAQNYHPTRGVRIRFSGKRVAARHSPTVSAVRRACPTWRHEPRVRSLSTGVATNAALVAVSATPTETISVPLSRRVRHKPWTGHPVLCHRSQRGRIRCNSLGSPGRRSTIDVVAIWAL